MIKKVKFIRNGDNFYPGLTYTVSPLRHKTLDSLLDELTDTTLCDKRILPKGVRYLFTYEGFGPIETLEELYDGETYICSSTKTINSTNRLRQHHHNQSNLKSTKLILLNNSSSLNDSNNSFSSFGNNNNASSLPSSPLFSKRHWRCCKGLDPGSRGHINDDLEDAREFIKPRLITVIRNGARPRKLVKVLLNKKTALSMEQALNEINTSVKLDSGPLKKVYMANGKPVSCLKDFFGEESLFFAYGNEKFSKDDLELTASEIVHATSSNKQAAGTINTSWTLFNGKSTPTEDLSPAKPHTSESQPDAFKVNDVSTVKKDRASVKTKSRVPDEPADLRSNYKMAEVIGQGRFATVKRCIELSTKCERALKVIDKREVTKEELSLLKNEVQMMKTIRHAHIIELFHDWETALHMYIIMEFANNGDLFDLISLMTSYPEREASRMLKDISCGVVYLHSFNIVHRDIKPENILVHLHKDDTITLKIGDLGLATTVTQPLFTVCGTPTYVAPEVISEVGYGLEVDVWSLGILTYILLCGYPPFSSDIDDQDELFDQIQSGKYEFESPYWDHVTEEAKGLINDMLDIDPKKRLKASDVFQHDWILKQQPKQQQKHDWNGDTKKNDVIINNNSSSSSMQQSQHISNNDTATTADETTQQHQFTIDDNDDIDDVIDKTTTTTITSSTTLMNHLKSDLVRIQSVHRLPQTHSAPGVLNGLMDRKLKYIGCKKQIHMSPRKKHPSNK